jgi:DNA-binding transcriptional LysR family regulator
MDRLDAMAAFVAIADLGGFSVAARKLDRSPASITRAIAFLEDGLGTTLLRRTTRSVRLTDAGDRYLAVCRRILADVAEAEQAAAGERVTPRGLLSVTAPVAFGRTHVRPIVDAFISANAEVQARLTLVDRVVNLIDEGIDVAVRIGPLPDSSLVATKVGEVRRLLVASPRYLARRGTPRSPSELGDHDCVTVSQIPWTFPSRPTAAAKILPRITVNIAEAAIDSALNHLGITRVLSYQVERELAAGRLVRILATHEPEPASVHVLYLPATTSSAKTRTFLDAIIPALRARLQKS